MILWLLAGLLSAIVVALLAGPLLARPRPAEEDAAGSGHPDLAVYRDQLAELEREVARGLVPEAEAATARLEIQRRILAAAAGSRSPAGATPSRRGWAGAALLLLLPAAAIAIYLDLGSPGLPALPFAERLAAAAPDQELAQMVAKLAARMKAHPEDPKGWVILADSLGQLGRYADSAEAYGKAIAALEAAHQPVAAELRSRQGEALVAAAQGQVTPAAKAAFDAALAADPKDSRARFYLALALSQAGHLDAALSQWVALEADSPPDAPWLQTLSAAIDDTARKLGRDPARLPGRKPPPPAAAGPGSGGGPTAADIAKAAAMTPAERTAFVDSMVAGLAGRLKDHPEDVDGWLRLATAYDKLGRPEDALGAWREAATRAPDRLDAQMAYVAAAALKVEAGSPPADFETAVARLQKLSPDNPLGLYCAGLVALGHGDKAGARDQWQKLLPLMPAGSPQRRQLEAKIAALGA
jgi:cytochrome c-type biogenesis protein CcmH